MLARRLAWKHFLDRGNAGSQRRANFAIHCDRIRPYMRGIGSGLDSVGFPAGMASATICQAADSDSESGPFGRRILAGSVDVSLQGSQHHPGLTSVAGRASRFRVDVLLLFL